MHRAALGVLAGLLLAALACSLPLGAASTPTPAPTLTPYPVPSATPTPTPAPALRNEAAHSALANGDWDLAEREFERVIAESDDPIVIGEALFGRGEALLRDEQLAEAERAFSEFLSSYPDHPRVPAALILRAQTNGSLGNNEAAVADYESYLAERSGVIDLYVYEWLGDALRRASRPLEAVPQYEAAILSPGQANILRLRIKIGRAYLEASDYARALEQFDQVYAQSSDAGTRASMNLLAGQALEAQGDLYGMYARFLDSFENFPAAFDTYVGLTRLVQDGVPVDDYQRGLVDYYAGAYEPAVAAFDRTLATNPSAAAYYYRGLSYLELGSPVLALQDLEAATQNYPAEPIWPEAMMTRARTEWAWLDRYTSAVETYLELAEGHPQSVEAAEALFAAGRTAERSNDLARAADIWLRLAEEYAGNPLAPDGAFEAGIVRYRLGDYAGAELAFLRSLDLAANTAQIARANLWIGKTLLAREDIEEANTAWEAASNADPTGYYSLRAEHLLEGAPAFEDSGVFSFSTDLEAERRLAEEWMRATFDIIGEDPLYELGPVLASDPRLVRGLELWNLGMLEEARAELSALRSSLSDDPEGTYRLMHTLLELGLYREAILASRQILHYAGMDDAATLQAPVYFNRIRFGPYFGDIVLPEAARYGLDGLFLLSVVRQESLFEGFATSVAAARGLMQVIPGTGESIAGQLGWPPDYESRDLYRPIVSVRFGTHYLSAQRDRFDGDLFAALAAYNGGPGNSIAWKELAPDDPDLFLEVIRFAETHRYIQVIYEVFEIYKSLYASG
ncbi:MAG: transglycosylase SLT domain-containing protein [Anaerolineae bacterium]|nr:MAG: transglycosylase SLT domain-containing protein [Anaerolineae bacterium]